MFKSISVAKVRTAFWSPLLLVNAKMNTSVTKLSQMAYIGDTPVDPVQFFLDLLKIQNMSFITMNLATADRDFGALNRVVVYRGLTDNHVTFVTEKNSRKYLNLIDDPRTSVTFYPVKGVESSWQIRLIGRAVELSPDQISNLWNEEPVSAKIRSRICESGKPIDFLQLKETHDSLLNAYEKGGDVLPLTEAYLHLSLKRETRALSEQNCILYGEFGVLNRNVNYRGLTDDNYVTFVTQRDSRKYANLIENSNVSVTFYMEIPNDKGSELTWQVRIFGKAIELTTEEISNLWKEETVFAKIRSRICECGKPIDFIQLKEAHDDLLKAYETGDDNLPQPEVYTAFKIVPTVWDFYKADVNCIGDRVQYRKCKTAEECWTVMHVAA